MKNEPIKALIIEDELASVRRLTKLVNEIDKDIDILTNVESVEEAVEWLESNPPPDLIFQDILLADVSSFEIFNRVNVSSPVIFVTAYDERAIEVFNINAIDYVLKPLKKMELSATLEKVKKQRLNGRLRSEINQQKRRFTIKGRREDYTVEMKDVAYFFTQSKVNFLVTNEGRKFPIERSLNEVHEIADRRRFFRINRQFIINKKAIKEMYIHSGSRIKVILEPTSCVEAIVSTERTPVFKKWLVGEMVS